MDAEEALVLTELNPVTEEALVLILVDSNFAEDEPLEVDFPSLLLVNVTLNSEL